MTDEHLNIKIEQYKSAVIFHLIGKLDLSEIQRFDNLYEAELTKNPKIIALNLSNLRYIDSSGIGTLVKSLNDAKKNNAKFFCVDLTENIKSIFTLAKLDQFIEATTTEELKNNIISNI